MDSVAVLRGLLAPLGSAARRRDIAVPVMLTAALDAILNTVPAAATARPLLVLKPWE